MVYIHKTELKSQFLPNPEPSSSSPTDLWQIPRGNHGAGAVVVPLRQDGMRAGPEKRPYGVDRGKSSSSSSSGSGTGSIGYQQICSPALMVL